MQVLLVVLNVIKSREGFGGRAESMRDVPVVRIKENESHVIIQTDMYLQKEAGSCSLINQHPSCRDARHVSTVLMAGIR